MPVVYFQIEGAFMQGMGYVTNEQLINSTENGKQIVLVQI